MRILTYFIDRGNGDYEPFYEYHRSDVGEDEFYARQLCTYFIMKGLQYQLTSNEMKGEEEILVLEEMGSNHRLSDEQDYHGKGLHVEFRSSLPEENYRLLHVRPCESHFEVIRYLLKDVVDIPFVGQVYTTSTEIDEDRGVYVVYVKEIEAD
ncbi:RNA helicase [Bacillus sp. DNRA2]|uniref:RNA helicase n=1 Tax=Bacillus sp. DNRA2 TaxID=2723053 RepID=UPI00145F2BAC|nr:RNA helicase [Bacillus sp. DNRA2]NMD69479.1 RNA helicase [Bacillus sp. DNRA2]